LEDLTASSIPDILGKVDCVINTYFLNSQGALWQTAYFMAKRQVVVQNVKTKNKRKGMAK
jgi:hypothetical protein